MNSFKLNARVVLGSFLSTWLICTPAWADDTEIYFGGTTSTSVKPNVLFILDTSSSMTSTDGGSDTRLDRMKTALTDILSNIQDVNVGLMRFSNPGGPILYPVTDIDATVVTTVQQDALSGTTNSRIDNGDDDVEQSSTGTMLLDSTTLDLTTVTTAATTTLSVQVAEDNDDAEEYVSSGYMKLNSGDLELMVENGTTEQLVGIRFDAVNIPPGATITNAWLEFGIEEQNSASANPVTILISGQDNSNPASFSTSNYNISGRTKTSANTTWSITTNPAVDSTLDSADISAVVQELVDRGDWSANLPMAFIIELVSGTGVRWVKTHDHGGSDGAILHVSYTTLSTNSLTTQVSNNSDSVAEASNGNVNANANSIDMAANGNPVGIRFASVNIPAGATITDARLEFEIDAENADAVTLDIYAEDVDSAITFSNSDNITSRYSALTTAKTTWAITTNPAVNNALYSPNLSTVVQEIVDRGGWSANNALAFVIKWLSGSGVRTVESYKGDSSAAPKLHITYVTGATAPTTQTIGLRFNNINIPQGATISSATASFTADNSNSISTDLVFYGEDADHSDSFTDSVSNLSSSNRPRTTANVGWNAAGTLGSWIDGNEYTSPDLTSIIQEIVNRSGWCGGNSLSLLVTGTGLRVAKSYENDPSQAVELNVTYDPASSPSGCMNHEFSVRVNASSDDAEQSSSGSIDLSSTDLELVTDATAQTVGIRFNDLQLNQGSTVASAFLEFAVDEIAPTAATTLTIRAENVDSSNTFTTVTNNISSRPTTTASVTWTITDQWSVEHELIRTPDIAPLINEILARGGWTPGNSLSFIITGSGKRVAESYDGSNLAPRLVYYTNPSNVPTTSNTVRSKLIEEVNNLDYKSGTPIVDTLYEAALYYRGDAVDYGKTRGSGSDAEKAKTRVSLASSYTGGALVQPAGCSADNLDSTNCAGEEITGSPMYDSPITESCQSNHIVLLTDGYASVNTDPGKVMAMTGDASCIDSGANACGPELVRYLQNNDQTTAFAQDQTITTHTIGFNFSDPWLANLASQGGGKSYEASTASSLTSAFDTIIKTIKAANSTFVEPSVTINQFNRFAHRDDVYFALFKPQETAKWYGNLKKYQLKGSPATLYDNRSPQQPAVDPATGFFAIDSKSFWSVDEDGNVVEKGGAASMHTTTRNIYTNVSSSAVLSASDNALHESNTLVTKSLLDIAAESDAYRTALVQWARGLDSNGAARKELGDPLHSRPELVTYDGYANPIESTIFFGTNEGYLHAVNINTGAEQFAFVPKELLSNLNTYYSNNVIANRPYGLDGSITLWTKDSNGDGDLKDSGEFAYLYVGMRRGGRSYYALDVTDVSNPRLMWQIDGGSGDFTHLGQTWSKVIKTRIKIDNVPKDVLVFGGGYDTNQDNVTVRTADGYGNAIYMVDALTGAKVWSAGPDVSHDESIADMTYSIPSEVKVLDMNRDGFVDQMYVGDMGGQVWRFDVDNEQAQVQHLVDVTKIADLADNATTGNRRFYYPPDIALAVEGKYRYLSLGIGSGYRAHPMNPTIQERFYMIKLFDVYEKPSSFATVYESDLYDATANLVQQGNDSQKTDAEIALSNNHVNRKEGWMIRLTNTGEKVLAGSATIQNQIIFTTYEPTPSSSGSCNPAQGTSRAYLVSLFDATPMLDIDEDGTVDAADRVIQLAIGSIPSTPTVIDTLESKPTVWVGPERLDQVDTDVESIRTYWIEVVNP